MMYNFDEIINRNRSASLKWDKYAGTKIIPMWVADMDFKAPPAVLEELNERIRHGVFGYSHAPERLNDIVCEKLYSCYKWKIDKKWIVWIPGIVSGLNLSCAAFAGPDRPVVTTIPIYPPFLSAPANTGRQLITVPLIEKNRRATLDMAALEQQFKKQAGLFLLCSPHNPCGTVFTRAELEQISALCRAHDVVLCSDEIHCDFILNSNLAHIPAASLSEEALEGTITLMAPSKTYNIPGLGCSFAVIADARLRKKFLLNMKGLIPSVNIMGLLAAQAAYEKCDDWRNELIGYLKTNRDLVQASVKKMKGCCMNPVDATYLAWIDTRQTGIKDPVSFFEKAGVGLSDGSFFGQKGFVRLNFGCPRSLLEKGLQRMETALNQRP